MRDTDVQDRCAVVEEVRRSQISFAHALVRVVVVPPELVLSDQPLTCLFGDGAAAAADGGGASVWEALLR